MPQGGKVENKVQTEAIALRKLREIKGLNRKDAGVLLDVGYKTIEKLENGRTSLNKTRIEKTVLAYGLTYQDFLLCLEGKSEQVKERLGHTKTKVLDDNKNRRSYKRVITKEVRVLQVLRRLKNLTQYKASFACGYSKTAIGHIENGRIELPKSRICHIVNSYGFTMEDFDYHMKSDVFVTDMQDDCIKIIKALGEEKLKAVYPLLSTFKN